VLAGYSNAGLGVVWTSQQNGAYAAQLCRRTSMSSLLAFKKRSGWFARHPLRRRRRVKRTLNRNERIPNCSRSASMPVAGNTHAPSHLTAVNLNLDSIPTHRPAPPLIRVRMDLSDNPASLGGRHFRHSAHLPQQAARSSGQQRDTRATCPPVRRIDHPPARRSSGPRRGRSTQPRTAPPGAPSFHPRQRPSDGREHHRPELERDSTHEQVAPVRLQKLTAVQRHRTSISEANAPNEDLNVGIEER